MNRILIVLAICMPLGSFAKDVHVKFEDLKKLIETQNSRVKASGLEADAAKAREGHLLRSFLPKIEIHAAQETFSKGTQGSRSQPAYGAEASINLYNGGQDKLHETGLQVRSRRKSYEAKISVVEELSRAREIYWIIVYNKSLINLIDELKKVNSLNLASAKRRIQSGVATESDRLEFEMKALELNRELGEAELIIRSNARDLLVLLGFEVSDNLQTDSQIMHLDEWESEIAHSHQEHDFLVKPSELASKEAEIAAKQAGRFWLPTLDIYAGWNQYNEREEDRTPAREREENVVGLRMKFNLGEGFSSYKETGSLRSEASAAKLISNYHRLVNESHVEREFDELKFLHQKVHEAEANIKSAEKYYRITQSEYGRGVKNSPDVLGASEKLYSMKQKRLEMLRDFQIARSHVLSKIGQ